MRTAVYVDGFNLFHSLLDGRRGAKWLDLHALASAALRPHNTIRLVRYFTARVKATDDDPGKPTRQDFYIRALRARDVVVHWGTFKERPKRRRLVDPPPPPASRYAEVWHREEKGSDVNLAVHMVNDAWSNAYDCAVVISNDSDLAEACHLVRSLGKVVGIIGSPQRPATELAHCSDFYRRIDLAVVRRCQLPHVLVDAQGRQLACPDSWRLEEGREE